MASPDIDPKIFWSGYGLRNSHSGIYHYGFNIAKELKNTKPTVIGFSSLDPNLLEFVTQKRLEKRAFSSVFESKLFQPQISYQEALNLSGGAKFIFHGLSNIDLPVLGKGHRGDQARFVLTVHDLIPLLYPKLVSRSYYLQFKYLLPLAVKRADAVICVSEWTRRCLNRFCKTVGKNIIVIPNGMELNTNELEGHTFAKAEQIRLLAVGRFEPYKRFDRIISVLNRYSDRCSFTVVTDAVGAKFFHRYAEPYIDQGKLKIMTSLTGAELCGYYQNCDVFFHPSESEGFGLPAAEALSHGKPVVFQSGSGLDEVVSSSVGVGLEANRLIDDWVGAIEQAYDRSHDTNWLELLKEHFNTKNSWKDSANSLKSVYNQILD